MTSRLRSGLERHYREIQTLGVTGWLRFEAQIRNRFVAARLGNTLTAKSLASPVTFRPGESDLEAFLQVFVRQEYDGIGALDPNGVILDCGANVGYSSAWLLSRYPSATILAIEPDPRNLTQLRLNLAPYGDSIEIVAGGVWSHDCGLVFDTDRFRDGLGWSTKVREARQGEVADVRGFSIPSIMKKYAIKRIALLKMDVEGAESEIFASGASWIEQCDNIAIELHDASCERAFFRTLPPGRFHITSRGELTFCTLAHPAA